MMWVEEARQGGLGLRAYVSWQRSKHEGGSEVVEWKEIEVKSRWRVGLSEAQDGTGQVLDFP